MSKKIILLGIFCLFGYIVQAQAKLADSIYNLMRSSRNPAQELRFAIDYCEAYRTYPYDTLRKYAAYAMALAQNLNDRQGINEGLYYTAMYYYKINKLDSARQYINEITATTGSANFSNTFRNKLDLLNTTITVKENDPEAALKSLYIIMARTEQQKDSISYINAMSGIGWVYLELGNTKEAKAWSLKGINMPLSENLMQYALHFYNNIIPCYGMEGKLDSVKYYTDKALLLADKYGDLLLKANVLNFKANLYMENGEYPRAIATLTQAITVRKYIDDPFYIVSDMATLSDIYDEAGYPDKGIATAREGLRIAQDNHIEAKLPLLYKALYYNYADKNDYKRASEALLKLSDLKDSLYQKASAKSIAEMEVKYKTAKKEKIIQQQQFALMHKNYLLYGSLILSMLIILLAIVAYRAYRNKQQIKMQKMQLQQQHLLTQSILQAEENERKRIATDLHDGLGQMLTAARYNLSGIAHCVQDWDEENKSVFHKAASLVDDSSREVRAISHNIMPNMLLSKGFTQAVRSFIGKINSRNLCINFNAVDIDEKTDMGMQVVLYRIIQECVNNAIKHADARKVDISVMNDESGISISIEDDGKGFNLNDMSGSNSIGLKSIRTRTEYLKGNLEIDTAPGRGTLVSVHIPKAIN